MAKIMADHDEQQESIYLHDLTDTTIHVLQLAALKGFKYDDVKDIMLQEWMPVAEIFANTVGAAITWWLRKYHNTHVWVEFETAEVDCYIGIAKFNGGEIINYEHKFGPYEIALLAIIKDVLNIMK